MESIANFIVKNQLLWAPFVTKYTGIVSWKEKAAEEAAAISGAGQAEL